MYVLIVDDDEHLRQSLKDLLTLFVPGIRIDEAANGQKGLLLVEQERPDYIIMDFQMPVMDGHDMALALEDHPEREKILLIGMSGSDIVTARLALTRSLCDLFLAKPPTFEGLKSIFASG